MSDDFANVINDLLMQAYTDLADKMEAAGRVVAPGAQVQQRWSDETNSFVFEVDTIPDPRLIDSE